MNLNIEQLSLPNIQGQEWDILMNLVNNNPIKGLEFIKTHKDLKQHWQITEELEDLKFQMLRNVISKQRETVVDSCGLIGFSSLNLQDTNLYLTEGVSDFITVKLTHPNHNVLGFTTLGGSRKAKAIVLSLFEKVCIVADNDTQAEINTGMRNAKRLMDMFTKHGIKSKILIPEPPYKDITDQFMFQLKVYQSEIQ